MRIGIDVRYLSHGLVGGIHTYLVNFIPALVECGRDHQFFLYCDDKRPFELPHLPANVSVRTLPYRNPASSVYNDLFMWRAMRHDRLDVSHFTANYGFAPPSSKMVITLHDEINVLPIREIVRGHAKKLKTLTMMTYLHYMSLAALRRADLLVTVSGYSKAQISRFSGFDPRRIVVVPHACPGDRQRVEDQAQLADVRKRLQLDRPFALAEAFKNPGVILRAWKLLSSDLRDAHELLFFSRSPNVLPVLQDALAAGEARLLVRVAPLDLSALYSMCQVFVFPSWIEGFGLPLIEAMTCGAPVVASDRAAIPEVVDDAAMLIDAEDETSLASYLTRLLKNAEERQRWRERGLARAAQFSWPASARLVLNAYQTLLEPAARIAG